MESWIYSYSVAISTIVDLAAVIVIIRRLETGKVLNSFSKYTMLQLNLLILIICHVIIGKQISLEAGIGIFAILAMIRFRSEVLKMEEMIAMLTIIGLGFIHAACPSLCTFPEVAAFDVMIIAVTFAVCKTKREFQTLKVKVDLGLIQPGRKRELYQKLEEKTGSKVNNINIQSIDLGEKEASLLVQMENIESKKSATMKEIPGKGIELAEVLTQNGRS